MLNLEQPAAGDVDDGKLSGTGTVDGKDLVAAGILRRTRDGVRLLAKGELKAKITIDVAGASKAAIAAVEKVGGTVLIGGKPAGGGRSAGGIGFGDARLLR